MEIHQVSDGEVTTLQITGEIDLHASPVLRQKLQASVKAKTPILLLDFSGVDYIDSSGLATLIEYVRECSEFSGKFALFALQKKVRTIFDFVRLNELFVIGASADEVLGTLKSK